MQFAKRILLFVATNLLVVLTISIVMSVLGVGNYLTAQGINYGALMVFCLIWGFGGAFISLAISRMMAKWSMGVQVIDPRTNDPDARWLVDSVYQMSRQAGLTVMPEVGVYDSPEVNAFATGPSRNRSLVAVSTGLLRNMNRDQAAGVLGHEVAHIANGDMVTMTLVQGVVNAFVMFFARIIAFAISQAVDEKAQDMVRFGATIALEIAFSFLGMFVVAWVSRQREFRADKGGATLAGRERMVSALRRLQQTVEMTDESQPALASMKISSRGGLMALLMTHPPLEERIRRLEVGV